jgi:hypothetical protein
MQAEFGRFFHFIGSSNWTRRRPWLCGSLFIRYQSGPCAYMGSAEAAQTARPDSDPPFWLAPWEFAIHSVVGSFIFGVISAPALGAEVAIKELEERHIDWVIIFGLKLLAYGIFFTDFLLFVVFLWRTANRAMKRL